MPSKALFRPAFTIRFALFALAGAILFGTFGFYFLEDWSLKDSFYVTVQTLTTVGYGDLTPKDGPGRAFAVLIMLIGAGGVALAITTLVQSAIQSELVATFGQRRQSKMIHNLHDHLIICGSGRVGSHLLRSLSRSGEVFVVIEKDAERAAEIRRHGTHVLVADATSEESLREAGVERARGLAACLPNDADNVYVVLTAHDLNPRLHIVARAAEEQAEAKLLRAGAHHVVAPTIIGGRRMAIGLTKPAVSEFIDSLTGSEVGLGFEQIQLAPSSALVGKKLHETPIRTVLNILVINLRREKGEMLFNPGPDETLEASDTLIAIGEVESLLKLNALAQGLRATP